jgi:hypothetical protein
MEREFMPEPEMFFIPILSSEDSIAGGYGYPCFISVSPLSSSACLESLLNVNRLLKEVYQSFEESSSKEL